MKLLELLDRSPHPKVGVQPAGLRADIKSQFFDIDVLIPSIWLQQISNIKLIAFPAVIP